jgi:AcrR family transcriptional regulator
VPRRLGRPPLTERDRAATRLEIARAAVRLFAAKGVAGTSAEEIAAASGISVRTLWRYFPTKERCVLPLLTPGVDRAARVMQRWRAGGDIDELVDDLERDRDEFTTDVPALLALVRLTRTEPALRAVWLHAHDDAEPVFATALARRAGVSPDDLAIRVRAGMVNSALRAAVEHHAFHTDPADPHEAGLAQAVRTALLIAANGVLQ